MTKRQKTATIISGSLLALCLCLAGINQGLFKNNELRHILQSGKLTVVTDDCSWSTDGQTGFHYEIAKAFADSLGVELEVLVVNGLDNQISALRDGQCSFIAQFVPKTTCYGPNIAFVEPFEQTHLVLVQRNDSNRLATQRQLNGKTVHIPQNKPMRMRMEHLADEVAINLTCTEVPGLTVQDLVRRVADGELDYTLCTAMQARILGKQFADGRLDFSLPVGFTQQYGLALDHDARDLHDALGRFWQEFTQTPRYREIYVRYFQPDRQN